jgi:4-hydroxybenzoyl-CoA reductase subunit beta
MLRLPRFEVIAPDSVAGVVAALATPGARVLAGGTDLLPNLKHRLDAPPLLVSLSKLRELERLEEDAAAGLFRIGAGVKLADIAASVQVRRHFPSFARAAGLVASPLLRNMGTIGGNLNLDTRCRYVNQTHFWREAIGGGCLKSEGKVCHVVPGGQSCVAAMSSDCVPALISLDARIALIGPGGERELALNDYYTTDGVFHLNRARDEFTTELRIPLPRAPRRSTYCKWTVRRSIDFPLISLALRFDLEAERDDAPISAARVCLGVLAARPKLLSRADALIGKRLSDPMTADLLCDLLAKQAKPLENVPYEALYRRKMIPVYARRALRDLE